MLKWYFGQSGNINWECESQKQIDTYCNTYILWTMKIIRDVESIIWTCLLIWIKLCKHFHWNLYLQCLYRLICWLVGFVCIKSCKCYTATFMHILKAFQIPSFVFSTLSSAMGTFVVSKNLLMECNSFLV